VIDIDHLKAWVGREHRRAEPLADFPARALAAALGRSRLPEAGEPLPPSWHWLYFLDTPSSTGTGIDGHPQKGGFLPPVPLPRRMWAGGGVHVLQPLRLGSPAEKLSVIRSVELKGGKTGALVFVNLDHEIHQDSRLCISEQQTLVYRDMPAEFAPLPDGELAAAAADWTAALEPSPVLLFRFSALTYNGHRIHYDRDYATREEFYPGLVVHAPLLATLLVDLALDNNPGMSIRQFRFRAIRPTFDLGPVTLCGARSGNEVSLWSADHDNFVGMRVMATLGKPP
jgi:3-methylfumaryl-CoA hydratase